MIGSLRPQQIGLIDTSKTKSSIMSPIWSSDGQKIAFASVNSSQAKEGKYLFSIYTVNQDGKGQQKVGEYLTDMPQELVLVGYSTVSNSISFYGFGGLPTPIKGSFSVMDVSSGKITNISSIPLDENTMKVVSSEDGQKFLIAEKTRLYSYNMVNNQLVTVYTIPSTDEKAYREGIREDGMFSFNSPKITIGGMDLRGMYFKDKDKVDFYYEFTRQQYYNPMTNSVEKPQ